ncbi:MAG: phytanoyl-CoA dioxygenase family protein [Phenylobacterium sp.]|uniref:phytanoyl-CoA dioxygenase family protein n=1 Tax=Phenylobacterium sp. TaxID=1871053 RepID=UPI001A4214A1|nr:phytanoyl-CoA dioxygenase family protein [Phenylobacterium sp.]MBL8555283.1 phytanoyl-CoA dioxygenase family protein [Phenylobacterium sp.]
MHTLPHHFEFLSEAWIDEARAWFIQRRDRLGAPFSVSERMSDAPPHLGLPDDVASWTVRWDGVEVSVAAGFDPAATATCEGDYQAALMAAQWVGLLLPGAAEAMLREVRAIFGPDAIRFGGRGLPEGTVELMALFHDHMGRATVENPDLAHRARRQKLSRHIREMEDQGYTIVEHAISDGFADEVREATIRALSENQSGVALNWMTYQGREFERLVQNPLLMTLIDASLGRGAVIASISAIRRGAGPGFIPMHTDYAHVPEPYPEFSLTGVGVWALEDWTVASGPTWIVPGSHKHRRPPREGEGHNQGVPVEMPKGSVVYFHHGVWHWQGDRTQDGERVTIHSHFNRGILRSLEPKKTDVQMLHRNPPRLGEMLGEDDWFDKMSAHGRDYGRFAYMERLLRFNEAGKREILGEAPAPRGQDLAALVP